MVSMVTGDGDWRVAALGSVDDLQDAVLGAGLETLQFSRGPVEGSLAFATSDGVTYSSGLLGGRVALSGALSEERVTLGLGVRLNPGSRQWLNEVFSGGIGIYHAGDEHRALYMPGSLYACATLTTDRLEEIAADMGLVLDARQLGGSGISPKRMADGSLNIVRKGFEQVHRGAANAFSSPVLGRFMLESLIGALAREPRLPPGARKPAGHGRIVARAIGFIEDNLTAPLSNRAVARAAFTSEATLHRAFLEVFDETPQSYVRKLRLNRIRRDLASEEEARCTITMIANRWGVSELGRFAGLYRSLFGELPSQTRAVALKNRAAPGAQSPSL